MIHAYDRILLGRAEEAFGRMLDFAVHSLHIEADSMMKLFVASNAAARFEHGDPGIILGMSGIELAYSILAGSGLSYERVSPRHTYGLSSEYWCGRALALAQWEASVSFADIMSYVSIQVLTAEYSSRKLKLLDSLPYDISTEMRAAELESLGASFRADVAARILSESSEAAGQDASRLKKTRIKNGLSQSALAKASGVPLRTIQQYEQRQKDINRAGAAYIIMLSSALNCDPASILERDLSASD